MRVTAIGLALAGVVLATGCATIVKGSSQTVTISSNVPGADIYLDGMKIGTTPFTGVIPKNKGVLMIQKPGFRAVNVSLSKTLEPIFWGNIITGGTLGSTTDFATGSAYQYAPASYQVDLISESQTQADFERRLTARKFAMIHLERISSDLAQGSGEHLDALLAIVNAERRGADADAIRRALIASDADPVRFGDRVVELL